MTEPTIICPNCKTEIKLTEPRASCFQNSERDARGPDARGPDARGPDARGPDARGPDARDPVGSRASCPHKNWHSRGYLPHCDTPGLLQAVTFRLADSLPADVLDRLRQEAGNEAEKHNRIEAFLDAGHGACWLKQPAIADIVEDALLHWDGQRYRLLAWCVMPNHVHALIETREGSPLSGVLHSWKSFTAKTINQRLGRTGTVWMRDYFDRYVRDDHHLAAVIAYIHANPVKTGLVQNEWEWPHSSASLIGTASVPPTNTNTTWTAGILPASTEEKGARGPVGPRTSCPQNSERDVRGPKSDPKTP